MKELQDILTSYEAVQRAEARAKLATVVKVRGSTCGRLGGRMLIREDGTSVGTLSSGRLEADVIERAMKIMSSLDPITVTYDTASPENEASGLNLGCNGIIQILLESIPPSVRSQHLKFLSDCTSEGKAGVIASVFRVEGELKASVGSHLFLAQDGKIEESVRNPALAAALTEDCVQALQSKSSCNKEYRFTEGVVEAFIEYVQPQ